MAGRGRDQLPDDRVDELFRYNNTQSSRVDYHRSRTDHHIEKLPTSVSTPEEFISLLQTQNDSLTSTVQILQGKLGRREEKIAKLEADIEKCKISPRSTSEIDISGYMEGIETDEENVAQVVQQLKRALVDSFDHRKNEVKELAKSSGQSREATGYQIKYPQSNDTAQVKVILELQDYKKLAADQDSEIKKLNSKLSAIENQAYDSRADLGSQLRQAVELAQALKDENHELTLRLSDEMSTKLSRDESSLENVSIKHRPMNITAEYQQLCSEQWLEAKAAVDEATKSTRYTEKDKLKFILDIFMNAQDRATEIVERSNSELYDLLLNPLGKKQSSVYGMRDKGTYDESQIPDKVKNTIHDFKRTTLESMDLSELVQQIEKSLGNFGSYTTSVWYEVKYHPEAKKSVMTLVSAIVSLVWKMVNQRPAMKFITPGINERFDPNNQDIQWGSPDLHGRSMYVDIYSHPVLMHGDKVMAKGKVLIKERY